MIEFERTSLGSLLDTGRALISGPFGSNISSRFFVDAGIPVIRGGNLTSGMERFVDDGFVYVTEDKANELRADAIADDLIFTAAGTIGQVGLIPKNAHYKRYVISNKQIRARLDQSKIDPLFAFYWFSAPASVANIQAHNTGSTIPLINLSVVRGLEIDLPNLNVQRRIVELLGSLDDKIGLNRQIAGTLEAMAQAIFRDWFVDFGPTRRKIEGASDPARIMGGLVNDAERAQQLADLFPASFGDNGLPEGWDNTTIGDIFDIRIGRTPPRKETEHFTGPGGGFPWMSIRDLGDCGTFISETAECLTRGAASKFRVPTIKRGTVVVSFKLTVGRVAIAGHDMLSNEAIAQLAKGERAQSRWFTYLWMKGFDYSRLGSTSSIATAVNSKSIKSVEFPVIHEELMVAFDQLVEPMFELIRIRSVESRALAGTRDLLLPKLMSGEIRLREADEVLEAAQ